MNKEYLIPIYTETGIYELFSFKYGSNREPYNLNLEILIENVDRNNIIEWSTAHANHRMLTFAL